MRRLPVSFALLLLVLGVSAASAESKLDPLARRAVAMLRAGVSRPTMKRLNAAVAETGEIDAFVSGTVTRGELEAAGARVRTELPGVFTVYIPIGAVDRVAALPGVRSIRGAARVKYKLNQSVPTTGAPNLRGGAPDFTGLNGAGVIVGDVDSGVDYDHGDFKNPDNTTRFVNIWDQTDLVGPSPAGYGYGSEWNAASINAHTARQVDSDGHGTHVMGIAGGDGSQTGGAIPAFTYVGMAPKADLVMVKTDLNDASIVDGVAYVMDRATALGKQAVVNLSLGSLFGPKDGTSPFDVAINELTGPGRIIVASAGNDGNIPVHAQITAPDAGTGTATMLVDDSFAGDYVAIDGYYPAAATLTVRVQTPTGVMLGPITLGNANATYPGTLTNAGRVYIENGLALTANGDREVYFEINIPDPNGTGANMTGTWTFFFQQPGGGGGGTGHDETTEDHTGAQWNASSGSAATPGTVGGGVTGTHLMISEVGWRGLNSASQTDSTEFIEIYNPTASTIDLSTYYLSDVNAYATLPVAGNVSLSSINTDFAMKFPNGATIAPGGVKVIAISGGPYARGAGAPANFCLTNGGGVTTAQLMTDVGVHTGTYPQFGCFTNGGEFVWLFQWDGVSDIVCDKDLIYWGSATGGNAPALKSSITCQDGPDGGSATTCYFDDAGNPGGALSKALVAPASGAGTRQRVGPEGTEATGGNGCSAGGGGGLVGGGGVVAAAAEIDLWIYAASELADFVIGADPTHELVGEPGTAPDVITVGAWVTKTGWTDCGNRSVAFNDPGTLGDIADFSSPGPTRDGREKPDISAPGMAIGAALTHDIATPCPGSATLYLNDGAQHTIEAGTSMSAPHVTGAVALLLQKYGAMTPNEVKTLLFSRALSDAFTGSVWNKDWGRGKLFLGDLTDPLAAVTSPNGGESVTIGSSASITWTASDAYAGVTGVDLELSRDDGGSWEPIASGLANSGSYLWNVTGPTTATARVRVTARDAALNAGVDASDAAFAINASVGVDGGAIADFSLRLATSNPVRGTARLEYAVPRESNVRIDVVDVTGRRAAVLADGVSAPGRYQATFDGGRSGAGIYFVRMSAAGRTIVRRVVMLK